MKNAFSSEVPVLAANGIVNLAEKVCKSNNIVFNPDMRQKIELFYTAMHYTSGLMLVGDEFTGKTTLLSVLSQIYSLKEVI